MNASFDLRSYFLVCANLSFCRFTVIYRSFPLPKFISRPNEGQQQVHIQSSKIDLIYEMGGSRKDEGFKTTCLVLNTIKWESRQDEGFHSNINRF